MSKLSRISIAFLVASIITPATQASALLLRQTSTCGGNTSLQQCGASFPSTFCCPKESTCMSLNSADVQSVICCPSGSDCAFIQPITCDLTQLDPTLHPGNQMHLSDTTNVKLPTCGGNCCPLGYTCKGSMCSKDEVPASQTPTSSTPTSSTTTPTASLPSSTTTPASASQTVGCPAPIQTQQGFSGKSFAAGLFPGIVIGALCALGLLWVIKKRREAQAKRYSGDFGHVSRQISDPIYDPQHAARTDFIRRGSRSAQASPNSTLTVVQNRASNVGWKPITGSTPTPRIKSMWDRTPKLNFGFTPAPPAPAVRAGADRDPYTTPRQTPKRIHSARRTSRTPNSETTKVASSIFRPPPTRSASTETIDVLMPAPNFLEPPRAPAMRENRFTAASSNTTFTKLMERAGFNEEERKDYRSPAKF